MRKIYALLAGFVMSLVSISTVNAGNVTPDVANFTDSVDAPNNNVYFTNTSIIGSEPGYRRALWSFGDGTGQMTGPLDNTQHHYQVAGAYNVCLKIYRYRTNIGDSVLSSYICKTVVIPTACNAEFQTLSVAANPLLKYFVAQPLNNQNKKPLQVCWHFGDGRDTCINYSTTYTGVYGVSHLYVYPGNYNVCVNILYDGGCQAQKCHPVQVGQPDSCGADFERLQPVPTSLSVYLKALPSHNNNRKPSRVCWTFGEGGRGDTCINYTETYTGLYVISHTYLHPGAYQVCVNIKYYGGCEATKCKPITIGVPDTCGADFEKIQSTNTNPLLAYYKALPAHNNNRKPSKVCWTFGEGGRGDTCINYTETYTGLYVISHTYLHPGLYQVCVQITYYGGCIANKCKPIQIGVPDTCGADFERLQPSPTSLSVYLKALPSHNNNRKPSRVCWTFGEGGRGDTCINYTETYTGLYVISHTYLHPGAYQVCVNIKYYGGCEATKCKPITIGVPDTCGADFEKIQSTNTNPLLAYYKALPAHNNNRKPSKVCWTFGEGGRGDTCINYTETYTGQYVISHTYLHPGLYQVCVQITYFGGCIANKCKPIQIGVPDTCGADFERLQPSPTSLSVYLKALPSHNNNRKPSRVCWTFGEGGRGDTCINYTETYTGLYVISHTYLHPGAYQVCVNIKYYGGCEASKCKPITIGVPDTCGADFEKIQSTNTNPLLAYYKALPAHNNNRKPSKVCWTFGEGGRGDTCINYTETYTGQYVISHTYLHPGLYQVCVQITYYGGCIANKCKPIQIGVPDTCGADFERLQPSPTSLSVYLKALPSHNNNRKPSRVCWTFGEGGRGDTCINYTETYTGLYVISHTYLHPGAYQVCVNIKYYGGCEASKCKPITIGVPDTCGADFERITSSGANPLLAYYKALPQHNNNRKPSKVCWHFGDGRDTCINYAESYTGQYVVSHLYAQPGQYQVCVEITYYGGCVATKCKLIPITGNQPILVLSPNPVINILHVDFFSTHTEQVNIKIFNSTGYPVMSFVRNVTTGPNSWTHDLSNLIQGVYSYTVQSPTQLASAAFIKL